MFRSFFKGFGIFFKNVFKSLARLPAGGLPNFWLPFGFPTGPKVNIKASGKNYFIPFMFQKISQLNSKKAFQRPYLNNRWEFGFHTLPLFFKSFSYCEIWSPHIRWIFFWNENGKRSLNVNLNTVIWILNLETLPKIQL